MMIRDTYGIKEHKHMNADYWHAVTKRHWYESITVTTQNQGVVNIISKRVE